MRENRAKQKLREGKPTVIVSPGISSDLIDLLGSMGFDGIWIDMEHGPVVWSELSDLSRACDLWGMSPIVRVPANDPSIIARTLARGITGIIVPQVNTKEEAARVVDAVKYGPIGHRGVASDRRGYGVSGYINKANDETIVVVMVEDIAGIKQLPEMLTLDHIDAFYVSHGDLAQTMGLLGQPHHPEVTAVFDKAIAQIVASGRIAGAMVNTADVEKYLEMGVRFLMVNWNTWVTAGSSQFLKKVQAKFP